MSSVAPLSDEIFGKNALTYYEKILALNEQDQKKDKKKVDKATKKIETKIRKKRRVQ